MKILYAIQGTGNGHLCRAMDIIPILQKKGEVDLLVSGTQADITLPYNIKFKFKGVSFIFGKKGGVDLWQTWLRNDSRRFLHDVRKLDLEVYDLIINDFEPVSAWAARLKGKACYALSHQAAVLDKNSPKPSKKDPFGRFILKHYAPAKYTYGFHFDAFNHNIFKPVIRQQVRELKISDVGHYTVYLPSYSDKALVNIFSNFPDIKWKIFSKHNKKEVWRENINIRPVNNEDFLKSMASSKGVICGAGFETPAEVIFLKKKLLVVPMKMQYEQQCNAAALEKIGVEILKDLKKKRFGKINKWLTNDRIIGSNYPDITENIIDHIISHFHNNHVSKTVSLLPKKLEILQ